MATIEKRGDSYRITVSAGYDISGKQLRQRMTWTPEPGMTKRRIDKELNRISVDFEEKVNSGTFIDSKIKFCDWCDEYLSVFKSKLAPRTWESYKKDIDTRIKPALGHIKLCNLNSMHVQRFIQMLQEKGQYNDQRYEAWKKRAEKLKKMAKLFRQLLQKKNI